MYVIECMQDAGKEDYLRPYERIGLDWINRISLVSVCGVCASCVGWRKA